MDDILIYSKSEAEHSEHVKQVLKKLEEVGLKLNIKKCEYGKKESNLWGM